MSEELTDLDELAKNYEEKGFFTRVVEMIKGFSAPKNSREYKLALVELQRLQAPLVAIVAPVLGIIILIVVTAVSGSSKEVIKVEIARAQEDLEDLQQDEPEPEDIDQTQDVDVQVDIDVPSPQMDTPAPPSPDPGGAPDTVATAPSPVSMAVPGVAKMRGLEGEGNFGAAVTGKKQDIEGCLVGYLIDTKRDASGKEKTQNMRANDAKLYFDALREVVKSGFAKTELNKHFQVPKRLAVTKMFIPEQPAKNGPAAFGADKDFKEGAWFAYYTGTLKPKKSGKYRFIGYFDEVMVVRINKKIVLECAYGVGPQQNANACPNHAMTGWKAKDTSMDKKIVSPQRNSFMVFGDWVEMKSGQEYTMDLVVGEGPGGACGGLLLIEEEGAKYETVDGRKKYPIFASRPLATKDKDNMKTYKWPFSVDSPIMNGRGTSAFAAMFKEDITVDVDI